MSTKIVDQYTDTSFSVLYSAMVKISSDDLKSVIEDIELDYDSTTKCASSNFAYEKEHLFPVNTRDNTILSKVYFDVQRNKFTDKVASIIESKLDTYLNLYDVPDTLFQYKMEKVASEAEPVYLLPQYSLCKVASEEDMLKAQDLFDREHLHLPLPDRVEFAQRYVKFAKDLNVHKFSPAISKYASQLDTDLANTQFLLEARAAAAERSGRVSDGYRKLAETVLSINKKNKEDLSKLAEDIYSLDIETGLAHSKYDKKLPCAYSTVFDKQAEASDVENEDKDELSTLTKAELISRYGSGILEEVEDEDGTIDVDKLRDVIVRSGGMAMPMVSDDTNAV